MYFLGGGSLDANGSRSVKSISYTILPLLTLLLRLTSKVRTRGCGAKSWQKKVAERIESDIQKVQKKEVEALKSAHKEVHHKFPCP